MSHELDDTLHVDSLGAGANAASITLTDDDLFAGRYRVQRLAGRGGMGAVYRVLDETLGETVALKLLTLEGDDAVQRFVREVRLARRVTHPNIARVHDFGEHEGVRYLTMEYVEGCSLDDVMHQIGVATAPRVASIAASIAAGLAAAHKAGVVHRDLKPANVMLTQDERVVITDFGIARATMTDDSQATQAVVGTPHYMAPEQVAGAPVDARTDIYALGVMLFELITGSLPFDGDEPMAVALARLQKPPPDPRERADVPNELANLIMRCMAQEPDARPASAEDVELALRGLADAASKPGTTPSMMSLYAPLAPARRAVAVLPFAFRGSSEHEYLGDGLAEELIDVLSRTKGLKVLSLGATRRFADERDPVRIGKELDASAVVDGTVQLAGTKLRLSARLIDTEGAEQRWSDRFEGRFEDVFELQESLGHRLAEALRVELTASSYRQTAPPEAIELYLRARKTLRAGLMSHAGDAVELLDRALELAPDFAVALAAHAMACVMAWWSTEHDAEGVRGERARRSVERAVQRAPELAETHQARAMLAVQSGDYRAAARALGRALEIAPTMAEAHLYLGALQIEAGRPKEGRRRLEQVLELDPTRVSCHLMLARNAALSGEVERHEKHRDLMESGYAGKALPLLISQFRWALYQGERERARRVLDGIAALGSPPAALMAQLCAIAFGEGATDDVKLALELSQQWINNERFISLMRQIIVDVLAFAGEHDLALDALDEASHGILIDTVWLERCKLFDALRNDPRFLLVQRRVTQRAADVWRL